MPLIGPLFYARWKEHRDSLKELIIGLIFSTITFWGTAILLMAIISTKELSYFQMINMTIAKGELFIFSVGLLGPILLATADDGEDSKSKAGRVWYIFLLALIGIFCAGFHSQIKAAQYENRLPSLNFDFIFSASLFISFVAVVLRYLALLYKKATFSPTLEIKNVEVDFSKSFAKRHANESKE